MKIIKAPTDYIIKIWTTSCYECGCEFEFSMKDTHLCSHGNDSKPEYYIQCPYCGTWRKYW